MADETLIADLEKKIADLEKQIVAKDAAGWMSDVQRVLALLLVGTFTFMIAVFAFRVMYSGDVTTIGALLKELKDALVQMVMMALGFFLGNTMGKMAQDVGQQKVVEKLTSPPPNGPVAPVPSSAAAPIAWWNRLTDAERTTIQAAATADPNDARLMSIVSGPTTIKPMPDDMAYLVAKNLLTQDRATAIQGA